MNNKQLLGLRKEISKRRPKFIIPDKQKRKEIPNKWRRPKGLHSKVRHGVWGKPSMVNTGYRGPAAVRGLHISGLEQILVHNPAQIETLDAKTQGAIIGHIGAKKKTAVIEACQKKGITILNINAEKTLEKITAKRTERKEKQKTRAQKKEKKAPAKKEEPKTEQAPTKEEQRKEMEKIVTKKE